jgi:hypothetical protein
VTAAQWGNLRWDIFNTLVHQNGTNPSIVTVATGDTIRFGAANPNNAYDTLANTLTTNRFALGAGQFVTEGLGSRQSTAAWISQKYIDITYTFSTSAAARFFFNSGGLLRITSSRSGGLSTAQNTAWSNLLTAAGTQSFGGQTPGAGFSPMNGTNFYRLTSGYQTYHTSTSSTPYGSNNYQLQAASNVADNSTGTVNIVYIRVLFTDGYVDPGNSGLGDNPNTIDGIDGTLTVSSDMIRPSGVMQVPPGTATFTIAGPSSNLASASFIFS